MAKPTGFIIYRGPSVLDGEPIIAVATMSTSNAKTGDMVQTWIMRDDVAPHEAVKTGQDSSVCGACPQRHYLGGACYVTTHQGPLSVWKAAQRGNYSTEWDPSTFAGRKVRLGAYGDPAAVPADVWVSVLDRASGWTGYTHQVRHKNFQHELLKWVMVSADTPRQASAMQGQGYRTFRVKTPDSPCLPGEVTCPTEYNDAANCAACGICNGAARDGKSVVINVHGSKASRYVAKYGNANLIPALNVA